LYAGNDSFTVNDGAGIAPPISVDGSFGTNSVTVNGTSGADSFSITGTSVSLGASTLNYTNAQTLAVNGLGGSDTFNMTGISATTATTLDGGGTPTDTDSFIGTFASDFSGTLLLSNVETASLSVTGSLTNGSSITGTGTNFTSVNIGTLAGTVLASGASISN